MRYVLAALTFVRRASISSLGTGLWSARIFIIANNPDGYGIDRCLASGAACGAAAANAYCRSRDFDNAASLPAGRALRTSPAWSRRAPRPCNIALCNEFVAIECAR